MWSDDPPNYETFQVNFRYFESILFVKKINCDLFQLTSKNVNYYLQSVLYIIFFSVVECMQSVFSYKVFVLRFEIFYDWLFLE